MDIPVGFRHYKDDITLVAALYELDPYVVAAVVWQESAFNTDAFRYEPNYWNRYLKLKPEYRQLNPRRVSSHYGLMQVLYAHVFEDQLLREEAYPPEHLFVPTFGLHAGCHLLRRCVEWASSFAVTDPAKRLESALAAYNGGRSSDNRPTGGTLRSGRYAREVLSKLNQLKTARVF